MENILFLYVLCWMSVGMCASDQHHINVCNYVPTDEEIQAILQREQNNQDDAGEQDESSHKIVTIKNYRPHDHILVSVLEDEVDLHGQYLYLVQGVLRSSGKPFGKFKSFDDFMHIRKCGDKEVFLDNQDANLPNDEILTGGVTFEWVAPGTKRHGSVDVIITKLDMNLLHRHRPSVAVDPPETEGV